MFAKKENVFETYPDNVKANVGKYVYHLTRKRTREGILKEGLRFYVNKFYDIWRIDTEIVDKEWVIDYMGLHDEPNKKEDYYVKCYSAIDREAITLCTLDIDVQENIEDENGLFITYINPIIARDEFIDKHGFEPEEEVLRLVNNTEFMDLSYENSTNEFYWKKLSKMKFSLQEEWSYRKIA